jgi:hypothetical protein
VTIHEHLDGNVSIRFGPHVVGRFDSKGEKLIHPVAGKRGGKDGSMEAGENQKQVSTASHADDGCHHQENGQGKSKGQTKNQGGGRVTLFQKADRSRIYKSGQLDLLTTGESRQEFPQNFSALPAKGQLHL